MDVLNKFFPLNFPPPSLPHILPFVFSPPALPHSYSLLSPLLSTPLCISPFLFFHSSSPSFPNKFPPPTLCLPRHPVITLSSPPFRTLRYLLPFPSRFLLPLTLPFIVSVLASSPSLCLSPLFPPPSNLLHHLPLPRRFVDQASIRNKFKTCCLCLFSSTGSLFFFGFCFIFFPRPALLSSLHPSISAFISHAVWLGTMLGASQRCRQMVHLLDVHQPSLLFLQLAF